MTPSRAARTDERDSTATRAACLIDRYSPLVRLTAADIAFAIQSTDATTEQFQGVKNIYAGTWGSRMIGRVGELAGERWFTDRLFPVLAHWRNPAATHLCDLEVLRQRIEVKSWSTRFWADLGRCIAVSQIERVARKANVVLWETVETACATRDAWEALTAVDVTLRGCSTIAEVRAAPVRLTGAAEIENHQLDEIRAIEEFLDYLTRVRWKRAKLAPNLVQGRFWTS